MGHLGACGGADGVLLNAEVNGVHQLVEATSPGFTQ